jgi:hypothetical protein
VPFAHIEYSSNCMKAKEMQRQGTILRLGVTYGYFDPVSTTSGKGKETVARKTL